MLAGFKSELVAGFILECVAGFVGIRIRHHGEVCVPLIAQYGCAKLAGMRPAFGSALLRRIGACAKRADTAAAEALLVLLAMMCGVAAASTSPTTTSLTVSANSSSAGFTLINPLILGDPEGLGEGIVLV